MKTSTLLLKLQKDIKPYGSKIKTKSDCLDENNLSLHCLMSRYNLENYHEILNSKSKGLNDEIDVKKLRDLEERIDKYFILHAPDDEDFKKFIKTISTYLTFIAKKPLHPPGIEFSNGNNVFKRGDSYYCTGKIQFLKDKFSLCKHCVAKCDP